MPTQFTTLCQETTLYNAWNIVKEKGAAGGIDGVTIQEFEKDKRRQISKLVEELTNKAWKPFPYLEIEIAKDKTPEEKRKLGMTAIRDKIVQLAIKSIIEPRYDRIFVGNSYGYRPGKGATKAIRRVLQECKNKKYKYVLRLDIDNFFDTIDHFLLRRRLVATGTEEEIVDNLSHVVVTGKGVSLSSNFISYCMERKIPIDFFDHHGKHIGSVVTPKYIQSTLWAKQSAASSALRNSIALAIIEGKVKNQHALLKYFNKYHKKQISQLQSLMESMEQEMAAFKQWKQNVSFDKDDFISKLMGHEAQIAVHYWDYIRELIADDNVDFERREHQGAQDLTNCLLNYGYAILYVRVWQALLAARLNPFDSLIHARQEGKPTLAYDLIEIFRSQVVDRMVISLIQKGHDLEVRNGLLTDNTRQLLVKSVMERLARYERYQGEEMKMENIIVRQAKLLAKNFEGSDKFKPYVAKW